MFLAIITPFQVFWVFVIYIGLLAAVILREAVKRKGVLNLSSGLWVLGSICIPFLVPLLYFISEYLIAKTQATSE